MPPQDATSAPSDLSSPMVSSKQWPGLAKLVLGSKSWSRRALLSELGVPAFTLAVPDIDEAAIRHSDARELVLALGNAKAAALLARGAVQAAPAADGKTLLVCGDAVVRHKGSILEKPVDFEEARSFLRSYASAPATTVSSVVVVDVAARRMWAAVDEAEVYFRAMPDDVVEELIKDGAMESAGGLRIEHRLAVQYTECIIGHRSAVMGFSQPLAEELLRKALKGEGGELMG